MQPHVLYQAARKGRGGGKADATRASVRGSGRLASHCINFPEFPGIVPTSLVQILISSLQLQANGHFSLSR